MELDDTTLVERCQQGDPTAFRRLVERYQRKVYNLAYGMVHNPEDAMELVQESLIKAYRNLDRFQGSSTFYTWLYRITVNVCIDWLRREKKGSAPLDYDDSVAHHEDVNPGEWPLVSSFGTETPVRTQSRRELADQIQRALESLSEAHRRIILLREIEGLSYQEIAEVLDIPKGTVMSRLFHARHNLQRMLRPYVERGDLGPDDKEEPEAETLENE